MPPVTFNMAGGRTDPVARRAGRLGSRQRELLETECLALGDRGTWCHSGLGLRFQLCVCQTLASFSWTLSFLMYKMGLTLPPPVARHTGKGSMC